MTLLDRIVEAKREELAAQMAAVGLEAVKNRARAGATARSLKAAVSAPGLSIIAEFKRRSPSLGGIDENADAAAVARRYEAAGADGISVLTERAHFGGGPRDLIKVKEATGLPVLRKDFIFDAYQVFEAKALGADAVLLIARILEGEALAGMLDACFEASVEAFVEVHDERELERALEAGADLIGVNNRDLATLEVDLSVVERLRPLVPEGVRLVSESGCRSRGDVERLSDIGVDAVLIGGALMEASNTEDKFAELFGRE
ncbi:MAG: indole-3-glycerol phosphate synthase TrpC [Actinobacteria bacterium]|nr:MAG: indole-3-glycerol phosphate synthase TrpC [Actinomycetota bacterium]